MSAQPHACATSSVSLRDETPDDVSAIAAVTTEAFRHAPHASHTEARVVDGLRAAGQLTVSIVAVEHGVVIGHVAVSPVVISGGCSGWFGLGPIAVAPSHQRQGVGAALMHEALERLVARGASGCVVLGDPGYYARFGFRPEASLVLPGVPPVYFQALALGDSLPSGIVAYPEAFAASA